MGILGTMGILLFTQITHYTHCTQYTQYTQVHFAYCYSVLRVGKKIPAPSMQRHTMRVVLVIAELCLETIYDNAILRFLGIHLFSAYNALG